MKTTNANKPYSSLPNINDHCDATDKICNKIEIYDKTMHMSTVVLTDDDNDNPNDNATKLFEKRRVSKSTPLLATNYMTLEELYKMIDDVVVSTNDESIKDIKDDDEGENYLMKTNGYIIIHSILFNVNDLRCDFDTFIKNETNWKLFSHYCQNEAKCYETILFIEAYTDYKTNYRTKNSYEIKKKAKDIANKFIAVNSPYELNIFDFTRIKIIGYLTRSFSELQLNMHITESNTDVKKTLMFQHDDERKLNLLIERDLLMTNDELKLLGMSTNTKLINIFDVAYREITQLLNHDVYPRFKRWIEDKSIIKNNGIIQGDIIESNSDKAKIAKKLKKRSSLSRTLRAFFSK
jgi:hypothetical protein